MLKINPSQITTVLFDLDGTLVDTAPDFMHVVQRLSAKYSLKPQTAQSKMRAAISHGTRGIIEAGLGVSESDPNFQALRTEFLEIYAEILSEFSKPFPGITEVLTFIGNRALRWGIVTNKPRLYTELLLQRMPFTPAPNCVVSGDTTNFSKPHPAPLRHACELLQVHPRECLFVGDNDIDVLAARAANIPVVVANYGYLDEGFDSRSWNADAYINAPIELLKLLET